MRCKRCRRPIAAGDGGRRLAIRCPHCGFTFSPHREASETRPDLRLRPDLVMEPFEEHGGSYYVIKDPETNRFFKIKPLEHYLISQFDGTTSLETIRRRASDQRKVLVSEEVLLRFAEKFRELGLLVDDSRPRAREKRLRNVFALKIPLANPERLLDRVYPKLRGLFGPTFIVAAALTILMAFGVAAANRSALVFGLGDVISLEGLLFVIATITLVTVLHELAHGLTCRHFGGRVTDMGFLLLYFIPCFYCNVSDVYLLREKRKRVWVIFAGAFFELFIWAVALVGWRLVAPETFASRVLYVIAAVCAVRTLFNLNPLIKMDGYFLLSDLLGISNLRKEALSGLGSFLRRAVGLPFERPRPELVARRILAMRGDRFLTLFGMGAVAYTAALVGALVYLGGGWVFGHFGADALFLYSVGLVGLLHKPALTAASTARDVSREKWDQLGERGRRRRFFLVWGVILLVALFFPWELRIPSELSVLPQEREIVRAPSKGRIARIYISEGMRVEKGALILEYDDNELKLERRTKQAELEQAREERRLLSKPNPTFREEIRVQERALEAARVDEAAALQDFERARQGWTLGVLSRDQFDRAKSYLEETQARLRQAEAQIALVRKSSPESRNEQMEVYHLRDASAQQAVIEKLEAELARLDDLLARTKIYASISGTLTTYRFEEKLGDYLEEGAEVCEIANDDRVVLEMPVSEKDIDVIEAGQPVKFKVRGYPTRSFRATVDEIAPVATQTGKTAAILIRAYVDNTDKLLKPGMTGVAKIYCGMSFVANILTRDIIRFIRTEFWL